MNFVIFGLSVASSWRNGHATIWRALCRELGARGHRVIFFERDLPYYAAHRDRNELPGAQLVRYSTWKECLPTARRAVWEADVAITTSDCPDALEAAKLSLDSRAPVSAFYDLDTPVTLARHRAGLPIPSIGPRALWDFDLVLSSAGGAALAALHSKLGARRVAPLYGCADPSAHYPAGVDDRFRATLSYLGTSSADRDRMLRQLFLEPARRLPEHRFLVSGALYSNTLPWPSNLHCIDHVSMAQQPAFFSSSRLTLNITRQPGQLFEATACGAAVLSDPWPGLDTFFAPGAEILLAYGPADVAEALTLSDGELEKIRRAGRERTLSSHTAAIRARELETILDACLSGTARCDRVA